MAMINLGGDPSKRTPEKRAALLRQMTYYDPVIFPQPQLPPTFVSDDTKMYLFQYLPTMTTAERMQLQPIGGPNAGGAYGTIKVKTGVGDRLWKEIRATPKYNIVDMGFMVIKEAFIQYVLSNDPDQGHMVPKVYSIKKAKIGPNYRLYIEMERGGKSLSTVMDDTAYPSPTNPDLLLTPFLPVCGYLSQALTALVHFYEKYAFTHRDLKMTNIIVSNDESHSQIVDFGMSCISILNSGVRYTIKAGIGYYHGTPCREQQDMAMLLMEMHYNYDLSDDYIKEFLDAAIPPSMRPDVAGTPMYLRRMATTNQIAYAVSYNRNGTFYPSLPAEDQEALKISVVLGKLNAIGQRYMEEHPNTAPANATAGGGRRRRRRSRTRKSMRR